MIAGSYIIFVVIRKIRVSIWAISLMWLFFIIRQFGIKIHLLDLDEGISIRVIPLFLQIPNIQDDPNSYTCSAFGSSKVI